MAEELIRKLWLAQLNHAHTMLTQILGDESHYVGDDGHDYLYGALSLAAQLEIIRYDGDDDEVIARLKLGEYDDQSLVNWGCDGVAEEVFKAFEEHHGHAYTEDDDCKVCNPEKEEGNG